MYTQIPFQRIVDSLSLCDQKLFNKEEYKNLNVCFEDIWNCLSDFEKKEIINKHADFFASVVLDSDLNVEAWDRIISKFKKTYNYWPDDFLDELNECDIVSYLKSCGYVIGAAI